MKSTSKELILLLKCDKANELEQKEIKFEDIQFNKNENLLKFVMRCIFFYRNNTFEQKNIISAKKKHTWLNDLLNNFYKVCEIDGDATIYNYSNGLFSLFYDKIKENYNSFINKLEGEKKQIQDLFTCFISFFSYLNGNDKYSNIISDIENNSIIIQPLRQLYNGKIKKSLWQIITDYCAMINIFILYDYKDMKKDKEVFDAELSELKCMADMCSINGIYQKFIQTLYKCIKGCNDIRKGKEESVQNFIEEIFLLLNISLRNCNSWDDDILLDILEAIYEKAFEYSSNNYNENYIDFVINYAVQFNISITDFFHLFLNGLIEENFKETFPNIKLKDDIININDENKIKELINMTSNIYIDTGVIDNDNKDADNKKFQEIELTNNIKNINNEEVKKSSINLESENIHQDKVSNNMEEIKEEKNEIVTTKDSEKGNNEYELLIKKFNDKFSKLENEISLLEKEISLLKKDKISNEKTINNLKKDYSVLKEYHSALSEKYRRTEIKLTKNIQNVNFLSKNLQIISYRDLTKRILDNMIHYISNKENGIFNGAYKRKEKLGILNNNYNYPGIEYMKKPIEEMSTKYYKYNSISHVPKIVHLFKKLPIGLKEKPTEKVGKNFLNLMINSTDDKVTEFMKNELNLNGEINELYFK